MKTRFCMECIFMQEDGLSDKPICIKGHSPRFYMPKGPYDFNYGFKRKCDDFELDEKIVKFITRESWT